MSISKNNLLLFILLGCLSLPSSLLFASDSEGKMTLTSTSVQDGKSLTKAQVFDKWGCTGKNVSPQLAWANVPEGTKSFAVTMYDPDAPTGSGWWHWMVVNIPAKVVSLSAHAGNETNEFLPEGARQIANDFGFKGFGGACPPEKAKPHNYTITVYALDVETLDLPENPTAAYGGYFIHQHMIDKAELIAPSSLR